MIVCISTLLDSAALGQVRALLARSRFGDGRATAGWHARLVKDNEQAEAAHPATREAAALVSAALLGNEVFRAAALPHLAGVHGGPAQSRQGSARYGTMTREGTRKARDGSRRR